MNLFFVPVASAARVDAAHESCHSQGMPSRPRGPVNVRIPPGDTHPRQVCDSCGFIHYVNPRIVVGALCLWEEKILLCRRAIEPRLRLWTLPAGYLEIGYPLRSRDVNMLGWRTRHPIPKAGSTTRAP